MAKRLARLSEVIIFILAISIFVVVANKYYTHNQNPLLSLNSYFAKRSSKNMQTVVCQAEAIRIDVPGGSLCRNKVEDSPYVKIFDTYPLHPEGRELIYRNTAKGSTEIADKIIRNEYQLPRYESVTIDDLSWEEDPYNEKYWRFNFYSLNPLNDLLFAYGATHDNKYKDKALELINDFAENGADKEHAWDDYHGAAFRTINLVNAWWKLRESNVLSVETSNKMLKLLQQHGEFLADKNHYEPQHNHGINEAAALLVLSNSFPDLAGAPEWAKLSSQRLSESLDNLIDSDGVLIENSPYYHFYTLEKYWGIYKYSKKYNVNISESFYSKIQKMVSYSAYILQPNLEIPTISASLKRKISYSGIYKEMAELDPGLKYVLTQGKQGARPKELNVEHPTAGQTIMRSGWSKGPDFIKQTQLIFNVGAYRTKHSHLDALSFNLFGSGSPLVVDSGLYTYEEGEMKQYFSGTSAHNTVVVDGQDQAKGKVSIGKSYESNGTFYQSAEEELNKGVIHKRAIALIDKNVVLIIDNLQSDTEHLYEQKFHLSPELTSKISGLSVGGYGKSGNRQLRISQLIKNGLEIKEARGQQSPPDGLCSYEYEQAVPCDDITYSTRGRSSTFVTAIEIGPSTNTSFNLSKDGKELDIQTPDKNYQIMINQTKEIGRIVKIANNKKTVFTPEKNPLLDTRQGWKITDGKGQNLNDFNNSDGQGIQITSNAEEKMIKIEKDIALNLADKNIHLEIKEETPTSIESLSLSFSNNNWMSSANINLKSTYRAEYENSWLPITLGLGELRKSAGAWQIIGAFDWSRIDKVRVRLSSKVNAPNSIWLKNFSTAPKQPNGAVVFIFDDGWGSVMSAYQLMESYGMKGNVAVIAGNLYSRAKNYLSVNEAKMLHDSGWGIANHSYYHKNALDEYSDKNNLQGLEDDILAGDKFLIDNGLNSAPNWYIYPNGATNANVREIVGKYYKFARTTNDGPEVFPYGDDYLVKSFSVHSSVSPDEVMNAVKDAKRFNQTLFLTLHKINSDLSKPNDSMSYYIDDFETILKGIKQEGINVKTLSQLDQDNGVPLANPEITGGIPSQIMLTIKSTKVVRIPGLSGILPPFSLWPIKTTK